MLPARTSYDLVVAHKSGKTFAIPSEQDGTVTNVDDTSMELTYKDGTKETISVGRSFTMAAGKTMPHNMVSDRNKGYKFKKGEILAWNSFYFDRDWLEPTQVALYTGVPAIVATRENGDTYEDGSSVSSKFASKSGSLVTYVQDTLINFDDGIDYKGVLNTEVDQDDVLVRIVPPGVDIDNVDEDSLDQLSTASIQHKNSGKIERIEVIYNGKLDEASSTVKSVINKFNKDRKERARLTGEYPTGELLEPTYIGKNYIGRNTVLIRTYVTTVDLTGVGSKVVFGNALKTVPGKVFSTEYKTVGGTDIDAVFSYKGIMARTVLSAERMGILNMLVRRIGFNACKAYRG